MDQPADLIHLPDMTFDEQIAARTLAQEARGEPLVGQLAVAQVLKNRLKDGRWGHSLASVCLWNAHIPSGGQGFQFSGWRGQDKNFAYACGLRDEDPMLSHMLQVLNDALDSVSDQTDGAMWYHAASIPPPEWTQGAIFCGQFGNQRFFRGVR